MAPQLGINPKLVGSGIVIGRVPRAPVPEISPRSRAEIEHRIRSYMSTRPRDAALIALVASGVHMSRIARMRLTEIADGESPIGDRVYLVPSNSSGKISVVSGLCADALSNLIGDVERTASRRDTYLMSIKSSTGRKPCRQWLYEVLRSTGIFGIEGVTQKSLLGCMADKEKKMSDIGESAKGESSKAREIVADLMKRKRIYDPETGKMKIFVGDGKTIETEVTKQFADEIRELGYEPKISECTPKDKISEASMQIISERVSKAVEIAANMAPMLATSHEQALRIIGAGIADSLSRLSKDPEAIISVVEQVLASLIMQRACIIAGVMEP